MCEIERGMVLLTGERRFPRLPLQTTCNHQMQDEPQLIFESNRDAFAEPAQVHDLFAAALTCGWRHTAEQKWIAEADSLQAAPANSRSQRGNVNINVR